MYMYLTETNTLWGKIAEKNFEDIYNTLWLLLCFFNRLLFHSTWNWNCAAFNVELSVFNADSMAAGWK